MQDWRVGYQTWSNSVEDRTNKIYNTDDFGVDQDGRDDIPEWGTQLS